MIRIPATTIATATISAVIESNWSHPGDLHQRQADEHAERGERVGAQVGGVALERRRLVGRACRREDARDHQVGDQPRTPMTAMPIPRRSTSEPATSRRIAS